VVSRLALPGGNQSSGSFGGLACLLACLLVCSSPCSASMRLGEEKILGSRDSFSLVLERARKMLKLVPNVR
jgi:hypothetical protein